jgi:hypothetical protein
MHLWCFHSRYIALLMHFIWYITCTHILIVLYVYIWIYHLLASRIIINNEYLVCWEFHFISGDNHYLTSRSYKNELNSTWILIMPNKLYYIEYFVRICNIHGLINYETKSLKLIDWGLKFHILHLMRDKRNSIC